ncbi:MAG: ATP-binding protein, partial [Chloroflexota bacterium]
GGLTVFQMVTNGIIGNDMGIYRLTFTLSQIFLPLLVYRVVVTQYEMALEDASITGRTPPAPQPVAQTRTVEVPQVSRAAEADALNAQLLRATGRILETGEHDDIPARIVSTVLEMLRADIGALLRLQDANYADITVAQDRLMERSVVGTSLNLDNQPTLVNAIERRAQRGLYPDRNVEELEDLYARLEIDSMGAVYFQPLTHNREIFAVIMIALPYTQRELRSEEIELLKGVGAVSGSLLAVSYHAQEAASYAEDRIIQAMIEGVSPSEMQADDVLQARKNMQERLSAAREQIQQLTKQVSELNLQLDTERTRLASLLGDSPEDLSISQRIVAITEEQEKLRDEREQLSKRVQEAEVALEGATAGTDNEAVMNRLTSALQREKEILEAEKIRLQTQLDELRTQDKQVAPSDMQRLISRMMSEKNDLQSERDQLAEQLDTIGQQLQALGIEDDVTGLSQWIAQLSEERAALEKQNNTLKRERDMLLNERKTVFSKIENEKSRDSQIDTMREKINSLMADRQSAAKIVHKLRAEREALVDKLNAVKAHRARLMAESAGFELKLEEAREEQYQLRAQIQELADTRSRLVDERDSALAETHALNTQLEQALSNIDGDPARMKRVNEEGVDSLKQMVKALSAERDALEQQLNQSRLALEQVELELTRAQVTTAKSNGAYPHYEPNDPDLLIGLVQELRQPMTSIYGYVDILMNEEVGILGESQRKNLELVAANILRLDSMISSLIKITQLDTGKFSLKPQPIDFVHLVERALTNDNIQFKERGLAVTLEIDDTIPMIPADDDAMSQVLNQLLSNAYLASPPESEINVTVAQRPVRYADEDTGRDSIYIAIRDSGGGIDPADIPRVFARKYKANNPLIEGLGDTGVGLSIARAIVNAHGGQLWVETEANVGSTFVFALPIASDLQPVDTEK